MNTSKLSLTTPSDREIVFTRQFNAPPQAVFDAWSQPTILKKWMYGPDEHSLDTCEIDLREGGTLRMVWRLPDGRLMGMSGTYKQITPPTRIVHTELFDQDWTGGETTVTTEFTNRDGGTLVTISIEYASKQGRDAALQSPMAEGMEQGHTRLDALLA